jgi:hypothetical protein
MSFHKNDCNKFITAGKKLKIKTFESVTKFFEAQLTTNKNDGTFECMELEHIKKRAHLKLKNKLRVKIHTRKDEHRTYQAKRKIASCNAQRCPCNDCEERHWYIARNRDRNRTYDDKRQAAKRPCIEHPSYCDREDNRHDNQPKKLGYEKPKSNGKVLCPIHSFPD